MNKLSDLKAEIRISIVNPATESNSVYGRGIAMLCLGVRDTGSLNASAKSMGMAYSKAWRIIKDTEAALDVVMLNRDGAHGSTLTEEGNKLLDTYLALEKELSEKAQKTYKSML